MVNVGFFGNTTLEPINRQFHLHSSCHGLVYSNYSVCSCSLSLQWTCGNTKGSGKILECW